MRPLQSLGLGLLLVVVTASAGGDGAVDLVPDPLGWLLVVVGVRRLPERVGRRSLLAGLATVAGLVSLVLWLPPLASRVLALDTSLRWVLDLPTPGFLLVLGLALGATADSAGDRAARGWWRVVVLGAALTALLPPVVYGAGVVGLAPVAVTVSVATLVTAVVLCFAHAGRAWAHDPVGTGPGNG